MLPSSQLCRGTREFLGCSSGRRAHRDWIPSSLYTQCTEVTSEFSLVREHSLQRDKVSHGWFAHGYTVRSEKWPKGYCFACPPLAFRPVALAGSCLNYSPGEWLIEGLGSLSSWDHSDTSQCRIKFFL